MRDILGAWQHLGCYKLVIFVFDDPALNIAIFKAKLLAWSNKKRWSRKEVYSPISHCDTLIYTSSIHRYI